MLEHPVCYKVHCAYYTEIRCVCLLFVTGTDSWLPIGKWQRASFRRVFDVGLKETFLSHPFFLSSSEIGFHEWHIWWQLNLDQAVPPSSAALSLSVLEPNSGVFPIPYPCRCFLQHLTGSIHKPTRSTCFPPRRHLFFTPRYLLSTEAAPSLVVVFYSRIVRPTSTSPLQYQYDCPIILLSPHIAPEFPLRDAKYKLQINVNNRRPFVTFGNRLDN